MNRSAPSSTKQGESGLEKQIRGSSLLLLGRLLSKFLNLGIQIAIVGLLTKDDFGAFAYGLAVVVAGELIVKLGLGRGASQLVPQYLEAGDRSRLVGSLAMVTGTIVLLGSLGYALLMLLAGSSWAGFPAGQGAQVVLILSLLAPIQALDSLCIQTLACFTSPGAIFLRKHVIGPGLRVVAVSAAYLSGGSTIVLAWAYLAGGAIGLLLCLQLTLRELYRNAVLPLPVTAWRIPWQRMLAVSMPLITHDLFFIATTAVSSVVLMLTGSEADVAAMRAVVPVAMLSLLVLQSFALLYMPSAIRNHSQRGADALRAHHWQSAAWVSVLSFPLFAVLFGLAPQLVALLFGSRYSDSAVLLAILAAGHYVTVCLAFNRETLQLLGLVMPIFWINTAAIALTFALAYWLCPTYGALGAAVAVTAARGLAAIGRHWVLTRPAALGGSPNQQRLIWFKIAAATVIAAAIGWYWRPPLLAALFCIAALSLVLLRSSSQSLDIQRCFPEVLRIPLVSRLVAP